MTQPGTLEDYGGLTSACCGAKIILHDICSDCKEHPEPEEEEQYTCPSGCDEGKHYQATGGEYFGAEPGTIVTDCGTCSGKGYLTEEEMQRYQQYKQRHNQ